MGGAACEQPYQTAIHCQRMSDPAPAGALCLLTQRMTQVALAVEQFATSARWETVWKGRQDGGRVANKR